MMITQFVLDRDIQRERERERERESTRERARERDRGMSGFLILVWGKFLEKFNIINNTSFFISNITLNKNSFTYIHCHLRLFLIISDDGGIPLPVATTSSGNMR